jgi:hypothetical protein
MPQNVNPQPGTKPHPNIQAPPGTKLYAPATCNDGNGGCYVVYGVKEGPHRPAHSRVRYVNAAIAAEHLSWAPELEDRTKPRLATDEEIAAYRAAGGQP